MKDYLKREIRFNDKVVYPRRTGSNLWLEQGIVVGMGTIEGLPYIRVLKKNGKVVTLQHMDRIVRVSR